jgi:hypothetical protein
MLSTLALAACTRAAPEPASSGPTDAGPPMTTTDANVPCVADPQTYADILNACTDAEAVDKPVDLSAMALADGGLAPLP